jgi:hypothetical protein
MLGRGLLGRLALLIGVLLLGLGVAACTPSQKPAPPGRDRPSAGSGSGPGSGLGLGPLGDPGGHADGEVCVPYAGHPVTFTAATVTVPGHRAVTVSGLRFHALTGLRVVHSVFVRHGLTGVGYWGSYPPPAATMRDDGIDWATSVAVSNAHLAPTTGHQSYDLVLALRATAKRAHYDHVDIAYSAGPLQFVYRGTLSATLKIRPKNC